VAQQGQGAKGIEPEIGTVVRTRGRAMVVRVQEHGRCTACGARFTCAPMGEKTREITLPNTISAKVGDKVEIVLRPQVRLSSVLAVLLLPVVLAFVGYALGWRLYGSEKPAVMTTLGGLVVGFVLAWGANHLLERRQDSPVRVRKWTRPCNY
jgi:positive regulator of sigma E activity